MKTIIFANQKGGVGKTTSTLCTSLILSKKYRVLTIDGDAQCNLTYSNFENMEFKNTLLDVLLKEKSIKDCIFKSSIGDFDVIKSDVRLVDADKRWTKMSDCLILKKLLKEVENDYDYCLIDCPPFLGVLSFNYFNTADYVVVPLNASCYSIQGISTLSEIISDVKESINPNIKIAGILLTQFLKNTNVGRQAESVLTEIAKQLNTKLFSSTIRKSVIVEKIISEKKNILFKSEANKIYEDYKNFTNELLEVIK